VEIRPCPCRARRPPDQAAGQTPAGDPAVPHVPAARRRSGRRPDRPPRCDLRIAQEKNLLSARSCHAKADPQGLGQSRMAGLVIRIQPDASPGQSHNAVERATVQQVPAQLLRNAATDGALARPAGTINGQYRYGRTHASTTSSPQLQAVSTKPGNEVPTFSTSRTTMGPSLCRLAMVKDMAMR
jgi:hypothetical protein